MTTYFVSNAGSNTAPYDTEAKAATSLGTVISVPVTNADTVKVSSTHTENTGGTVTYTLPTSVGLKVLSVTFNGSGTGALAAGGAVNTNGNFALNINGFGYFNGITLTTGAGGNSSSASILPATASQAHWQVYDGCAFYTNSTNAAARVTAGPTNSSSNRDCLIQFINTSFRFGATGQGISLREGVMDCINISLNASGTAPTTLFALNNTLSGIITVSASDLTGKTWTNFVDATTAAPSRIYARQCKFASGFTLATGSFAGPGGLEVEVIDCDSGDNHYTYLKSTWAGTIVATNTIYSNSSNGTDSFSIHMTGNANSSFTCPLISTPITQWNAATGSGKTTTVEVDNDGTTFTNAQLWQETAAKITSGSTASTWNLGNRVADILTGGSNQATSTATWTGTGGFGAEVKQKLVSGSFTPAEVGAVTTLVKLATNDDVYVSLRATLA